MAKRKKKMSIHARLTRDIQLKKQNIAALLQKTRDEPNSFEAQNKAILLRSENQKLRELKGRLSKLSN